MNFWSNYPFVDRIKSIYSSYKKRLFTLKDVNFSQKEIPEFLLNISNKESSLNSLKDLHWIKLELPPHSASKDFARHLFCQTNCFPFINMNKRKLLKKVKAPFKILKLNTENHFVDVMSIENTEGEIYTPYNTITNLNSRAGMYRVISDGVQRINGKKATEAINSILDTIKEERNAFAAQNPDWIADELLDIKRQ